jgi:hypothetical protein
MGTNVMLHGQSPTSLNSVGKPKWIPIQVDANGVLVSGGSTTTPAPGGGTHDFATGALVVTLANGTEVEVVLNGVAVPRSVAVDVASGDTIRIRHRYAEGGTWFQNSELLALTADAEETLVAPVYSIGITRTAGSGTTSTVVIR